MTARAMRAHIRRIYKREQEAFRQHSNQMRGACLDQCEARQRVHFTGELLRELMQTFGMRKPKTD